LVDEGFTVYTNPIDKGKKATKQNGRSSRDEGVRFSKSGKWTQSLVHVKGGNHTALPWCRVGCGMVGFIWGGFYTMGGRGGLVANKQKSPCSG